jgi:sugar-specific transcriptional regulator TrmB
VLSEFGFSRAEIEALVVSGAAVAAELSSAHND